MCLRLILIYLHVDSDSIFEGDSYQSKSDVNNQNIKKTIPNTYPPKGYKGIKSIIWFSFFFFEENDF
jgi:hypothetical protein